MGIFDRIVQGAASWASERTDRTGEGGANDPGDDDVPAFRTGPGYSGAPVDLVEDVANSLGKSADEVTSDDIDAHIDSEPFDSDGPAFSDCDECGDKPWVDYCPECDRADD